MSLLYFFYIFMELVEYILFIKLSPLLPWKVYATLFKVLPIILNILKCLYSTQWVSQYALLFVVFPTQYVNIKML